MQEWIESKISPSIDTIQTTNIASKNLLATTDDDNRNKKCCSQEKKLEKMSDIQTRKRERRGRN